jgi:hypothetical protein
MMPPTYNLCPSGVSILDKDHLAQIQCAALGAPHQLTQAGPLHHLHILQAVAQLKRGKKMKSARIRNMPF